ncbi:uncharacterized protein MEPE_00714 [Melanopsichium pennsylvanicum]|uniref:Mediator complex subunit 17 n=1 Tax=Melanopsichium pennsylvanicum TaxID=63383 RepID=A0AAJ4XGK4_9BASI|nr:uncharacterized protein MEPE_00714 [Melanopsichium pennsylvanicum]
MSNSFEVGPSQSSTSAASTSQQDVRLSLEPVHIYADPDSDADHNLLPSTHSILVSFEREPKLADITADGTNIFVNRKPASARLSEDVHRLWAERGDFSRFRTTDLSLNKKRSRNSSPSPTPSSISFDDDDDNHAGEKLGEKAKKDARSEQGEDLLRKSGDKVGGTIQETKFVELRNKVLGNLDLAHFNSIHAHQLLGMLIKQHRSAVTSTTHSSTTAAGRIASPAPSIGGQSNRSNPPTTTTLTTTTTTTTTTTGPSTRNMAAPLGIFSHLTNPANREQEFVLDPLAISLSRTSLNVSTAARRHLGHYGGGQDKMEEEEDEEEDEYDQDPSSAGYALRQAKREMQATDEYKQTKLTQFKVVLETKRKSIRNAADLLSCAAQELRMGQGANRERWRSLIGLHGRGWGLTPGRPLLDVERFGVSVNEDDEEEEGVQEEGSQSDKIAGDSADVIDGGEKGEVKKSKRGGNVGKEKKKPAGLQGFGTPIITSDGKVKEEGARDAWIGFGLPEAPIELRRRSIAYWADLPSSSSSFSSSSGGSLSKQEVRAKLVFPDRMHRRLRVRFVLWPSSTPSAMNVAGGEQAWSKGERWEWSSDVPESTASQEETEATAAEAKSEVVVVGQVLDQELQKASREASDELVFGDVVAQARLLPPAFGVRLTSSSVRIVLTKRLDLIVELVPTFTCTSVQNSEEKRGRGENIVRYAPIANVMLAFLRLGPLRKYQTFVSATMMGTRTDAAARATAIKASAVVVPKKSSSSSSFSSSSTAAGAAGGAAAGGGSWRKGRNEGGKGIAAGGKATSRALGKLDMLGPMVVGLHYWSFVFRLGSVLRELQMCIEQEEKGHKVRVKLIPITCYAMNHDDEGRTKSSNLRKLLKLNRLLGLIVDATPSQLHPYVTEGHSNRIGGMGGDGMHSRYNSDNNLTITNNVVGIGRESDMLTVFKGYGKVFLGQNLVCTLCFAQPSLLSVQFAIPNRIGSNINKNVDVNRGQGGVRLTNQPISVDLDTLSTLLYQQIRQYT